MSNALSNILNIIVIIQKEIYQLYQSEYIIALIQSIPWYKDNILFITMEIF